MKNNEASIFVFIASIIVGIMISLNISFSNKDSMPILDAKQYEDATITKNKLLDQISQMNDQYNLSYTKLNKYDSIGQNNLKVEQEMQSELLQNSMIFGENDIHGPGIQITLNDAGDGLKTSASIYMVHYFDLAMVLDELKCAGAEAISVNGVRVTDRTSMTCSGVFIQINGIQIYTPFVISVIGNKDVLYEYMNRKEGYLSEMLYLRQLYVDIKQKDDLRINGYKDSISSKFQNILTK